MAIKIGVIGAGHFGKYHIQALKKIPNVELVGFYDIDPFVQNFVSNEYQIKSYPSYESILNDVDIVDIVTPTISHFDCAVEAIRCHKHIFIEKPVTHTVETAEKLINLAYEAGIKAQVGHIERFNPAFLAVEKIINKPAFIEAHRLQPFTNRSLDVSVILNLMIHDLDIILHIVNSNIKKISASGASIVTNMPDVANARIEFENGCVAHLTSSRISVENLRNLKIFQKESSITIDFLNKKAEIIFAKLNNNTTDELSSIELWSEHPTVQNNNAILEELKSFIYSIENDTTPIVTLEHGFLALKVAFEIMEKVKFSFD